MAWSRRWTRGRARSCRRSTSRSAMIPITSSTPPARRRPARSESDDPPAPSTRRPRRPRAPHRDTEGLAHPAAFAALERVAAGEPGDEPDPNVGVGPLLAGAGRPDLRAPVGRVRHRVLEVARRAVAEPARQPGRDGPPQVPPPILT